MLIIFTWILISGRDPDHRFSGVSVLRNAGVVAALTEDRGLVVYIPHLHRQSLGGGERGQAVVHGTDAHTVETLRLIVQRGWEKQEACRRRKKMNFERDGFFIFFKQEWLGIFWS